MKYVLCVDSGNGHTKGYTEPVRGVIYKVLNRQSSKLCLVNNCREWYKISDGTKYIHSAMLFEELPDDILSTENSDLSKLIPVDIEINIETEKMSKEVVK